MRKAIDRAIIADFVLIPLFGGLPSLILLLVPLHSDHDSLVWGSRRAAGSG
jgi:hypothetical protein